MKKRLLKEEGWTITELMFTLTILGFLLTLAVPALSSIGERIEKELFLGFLESDLELAQMEALARQEEVVVKVDVNFVEIVQSNHVLRKMIIPKRYTLKSNYADQHILFRKTGQVKGGTLWLCKEDHPVGQIKIQVASGRPRIEILGT